MMKSNAPAGFFLRLMAFLIENLLLLLLTSLLLWNISLNKTLNSLYQGVIVFLIIIVFRLLLGMVYEVLFVYYFGGNLGKLITGLQIKDQEGNKLTFNKILFRQLLSYQFSWLVFGLGFLSILKDPQKQAWHDKTVDSNVFKVKPFLPLAIIVFLLLAGTNGYLLKTSVDNFLQSPVKQEVLGLVEAFNQQNQQASKDSKLNPQNNKPQKDLNYLQTLPSVKPIPQSTAPAATTLNYSQQNIDEWKVEVDQVSNDLQTMQKFLNNPSYDQAKIQKLNTLLVQMQTIAERIYNKMLQKQILTTKDEQDIQAYDNYYTQEQVLVKELFPRK